MFNIYFHGSRKKKIIAITFDDGSANETEKVLYLLQKYNAKATFRRGKAYSDLILFINALRPHTIKNKGIIPMKIGIRNK